MTTTTTADPVIANHRVRLGHVALAAARPDRLEFFYRDLIGLQVVHRGGNELAGGAVLLSGRPEEEDHELVLLNNPQAAHVAFRVPSQTALADFRRRAFAAGAPMPLAAQDFGVAWSVFVTDPEGNHVEVYWATGRPRADRRPLDPDLLERAGRAGGQP
jgi:catechol-2,3-dioxygenase